MQFLSLSAVLSGVKEIRAAVEQARLARQQESRPTLLFIDEVHRFNKSQQDAFLPHVEDGTLVFIGATTENPSFELNNALLSRARTYVLRALAGEELEQIIEQALQDSERGLGGSGLGITPEARRLLAEAADGDAAACLSTCWRLPPIWQSKGRSASSLIGEVGQRHPGVASTRVVRPSTIRSRHYTNRCAARPPMRPSTGWRE